MAVKSGPKLLSSFAITVAISGRVGLSTAIGPSILGEKLRTLVVMSRMGLILSKPDSFAMVASLSLMNSRRSWTFPIVILAPAMV